MDRCKTKRSTAPEQERIASTRDQQDNETKRATSDEQKQRPESLRLGVWGRSSESWRLESTNGSNGQNVLEFGLGLIQHNTSIIAGKDLLVKFQCQRNNSLAIGSDSQAQVW